MKPEIKEQWVAALNSGEYIQGKEELRTKDNTYCCLGVLCDLAVRASIAKWENHKGHGWLIMPTDHTFRDEYDENVGGAWLPKFIREWSGLMCDNPDVRIDDEDLPVGLSVLNDNKRMNFHEIAEVIQEQL